MRAYVRLLDRKENKSSLVFSEKRLGKKLAFKLSDFELRRSYNQLCFAVKALVEEGDLRDALRAIRFVNWHGLW